MPPKPKYRRILLKLSGEGLMGDRQFGLDPETVERICGEIKNVYDKGVQVCLVIGAGNIFRGVSEAAAGTERTSSDYMGMLATVMNSLAVQSVLENMGVQTRVQSAIPMATVCEPYIRRRAVRHMEKGRLVIFAAGTGNPYFSTDTAAALRAMEIHAEILMKGTKVGGLYTADPETDPAAEHIARITYLKVLEQRLRVMDATAITTCMDNNLPILIFNLRKQGNMIKAVLGEQIGSMISS